MGRVVRPYQLALLRRVVVALVDGDCSDLAGRTVCRLLRSIFKGQTARVVLRWRQDRALAQVHRIVFYVFVSLFRVVGGRGLGLLYLWQILAGLHFERGTVQAYQGAVWLIFTAAFVIRVLGLGAAVLVVFDRIFQVCRVL